MPELFYMIAEPHELDARDANDISALLLQLSPNARPISLAELWTVADKATFIIARDSDQARGLIVGCATLSVLTVPTGRRGYVDDVVVHKAFRGRGISLRMMELLIMQAQHDSLKCVELTCNATRKVANALYRSLDFAPLDTTFYRLML